MGLAKFTNRAASTLSVGVSAVATSLSLAAGTGSRFPVLAAGEYFGLVIQNGDNDPDAREYCYCTARAGDTLTVERAQDGSTAQAFSSGATVAATVIAGQFDYFLQKDGDKALGPIDLAAEVQITAAATTNIGASASNFIEVQGATSITSFGANTAGQWRVLRFSDATPGLITHNASSLILPGGNSYRPKQGDVLMMLGLGSSNWRCVLNQGGTTDEDPTGKFGQFMRASAPAGWIAGDGGTIGNVGSGATRASLDTYALFVLWWTDYSNAQCPILTSAGAGSTRGASAAADWVAGKRLTVFDVRDRVPRMSGATFLNGTKYATTTQPHSHRLPLGWDGGANIYLWNDGSGNPALGSTVELGAGFSQASKTGSGSGAIRVGRTDVNLTDQLQESAPNTIAMLGCFKL